MSTPYAATLEHLTDAETDLTAELQRLRTENAEMGEHFTRCVRAIDALLDAATPAERSLAWEEAQLISDDLGYLVVTE